MTKTGDFVIKYYNHYGSALKSLATNSVNMTISHEIAKAFILCDANKNNEDDHAVAASYTVDRRVYNSLDKDNRF